MSGGVNHTGRASIPAPQRNQRNPSVLRDMPETGNTQQATTIPQSGGIPPAASGADLRDAVGPTPCFPPEGVPTAPVQSSGQGRSFRGVPADELPWMTVARAKRLMRGQGLDLYQTAHALGVRPRDLDLSLWNNLGGTGW